MDPKAKAAVISELVEESDKRILSLQEQLAFEQRYREDLAVKGKLQCPKANHVASEKTDISATIMSAMAMPDKVKIILTGVESMKASEIAKVLADNGMKSTAKKGLLPTVISALCRRDDLFESPTRGVYRLKVK
ncbi:MAG: hypothetical protein EXS05_04845 [Planctomycetaceae bacterium]|nr:hypothetical protein [Planctomycetaceae bacterium]